MKEDKHIHIVSFDIPYPPDYGGIIDVFYKIYYLHKAGYKVILHCFQYKDKKASEVLERYCEKVYYYRRDLSFKKHLSFLPFTVYSRMNKELLHNLLQDDYPILFETLHCAYYIQDKALKNRKKILRLSNIEHHYYYHLFLSEKNLLKKIYFLIESIKLYFFEKNAFHYADVILPVTHKDKEYVNAYYSNKTNILLPCFHPYVNNSICLGKGDYLLYHGNLSVAENYDAAEFLINKIAPKVQIPIIIAGKNPPSFLIKKAQKYDHIQIVENPEEEEMKQLIQNAQIVWLYTNQATGLKLKLIYSLFTARFIISNDKMLAGTSIKPNTSLYIKNAVEEIVSTIKNLENQEFDEYCLRERSILLEEFDNREGIRKLTSLL